jgi:hypothetical protein
MIASERRSDSSSTSPQSIECRRYAKSTRPTLTWADVEPTLGQNAVSAVLVPLDPAERTLKSAVSARRMGYSTPNDPSPKLGKPHGSIGRRHPVDLAS